MAIEKEWVVVVYKNGDDEDTTNVEDKETPENSFDRSRDGLAGVLRFTQGRRDDLGTNERCLSDRSQGEMKKTHRKQLVPSMPRKLGNAPTSPVYIHHLPIPID